MMLPAEESRIWLEHLIQVFGKAAPPKFVRQARFMFLLCFLFCIFPVTSSPRRLEVKGPPS